MSMTIIEQQFEFSAAPDGRDLLAHFRTECERRLVKGAVPIRFVVTETADVGYTSEVGVIQGAPVESRAVASVFDFRARVVQDSKSFNAVLIVPTGVGAEIGGHAGDAGPVARMLAEVCDTLVLHPNVVNASDLNEMPRNALYVEGSVVSRLLMGTVGLERVRANRVLVAIDSHRDDLFTNAAVNAVNGARAAYGLSCTEIVCIDPPVRLTARYTPSGRAAGRVEQLEGLLEALRSHKGRYDAVAVSSVIDLPEELHQGYFDAGGEMVNPWGGVEAMLTHGLSNVFGVPTAHSPMFESRKIANADPGIVDPRMAAEAVSLTFLQCTLKGLRQSPRIVTNIEAMRGRDVLTADSVSCVVVPQGCLGIPVVAALKQSIMVIAVRENRNLMRNDLSRLPWALGQYVEVENYWEAAGVIAAVRSGIDPASVRRPLERTKVSRMAASNVPDGTLSSIE